MAELRTDDNSITNQSLAEFLNYAWLQNPVKVIANTNNFSQIRGFANSVETPRLTGCLPSLICFPIFAISSVSRDPECLICSWLVVLVWRVLCQPRKMGINQSCHWLGANPSPVWLVERKQNGGNWWTGCLTWHGYSVRCGAWWCEHLAQNFCGSRYQCFVLQGLCISAQRTGSRKILFATWNCNPSENLQRFVLLG